MCFYKCKKKIKYIHMFLFTVVVTAVSVGIIKGYCQYQAFA